MWFEELLETKPYPPKELLTPCAEDYQAADWSASCPLSPKKTGPTQFVLLKHRPPLCDAFRNLSDNQTKFRTTVLAFCFVRLNLPPDDSRSKKKGEERKICSLKLLQGWCAHLMFECFTLASPHFTSCFRV